MKSLWLFVLVALVATTLGAELSKIEKKLQELTGDDLKGSNK